MQTLQTREKSLHTVCMQTVQTMTKSAECANCRLFQKKYASILHKVCKVCTCSAASLQANDLVVWREQVVGKNADLMHT
jgi:hypothetical protein